MAQLRSALLFLAIFAPLPVPASTLAYGVDTHDRISRLAYEESLPDLRANFFNALNIPENTRFSGEPAAFWVKEGARHEDDYSIGIHPNLNCEAIRPLCHFHDPEHNHGLKAPGVSASSSVAWGIAGIAEVNGDPRENAFSYRRARWHFFEGLRTNSDIELSLMFQSLGHVIHLIQDAAQPQHVRNEPHLGLGLVEGLFGARSVYEDLVDNLGLVHLMQRAYPVPAFALPQHFFVGVEKGIAEFTNRNFVSERTNCHTVVPGSVPPALPCRAQGDYPSPANLETQDNETLTDLAFGGDFNKCLQVLNDLKVPNASLVCTVPVVFFGNTVDDRFVPGGVNRRMTTYSFLDKDLLSIGGAAEFSLNSFNYLNQAEFLLPRARAYSAGLLSYFFRGSMAVTASAGGTNVTLTVKNTTSYGQTMENMGTGSLFIFYDSATNGRQPVPGACPSTGCAVTNNVNDMGETISFALPSDFASGHENEYLVVYRGWLGAEADAVVGTAVRILAAGPAPRESHAMAFDTVRGVSVLFGGEITGTVPGAPGQSVPYGDTWLFDGSAWTQVAAQGPSARWSHAMAFDSSRNTNVLFGGGAGGSSQQGDTWLFDGVSWNKSPAVGPAPRGHHAMAFDPARQVTVLFGGVLGGGPPIYGDTWIFNGTNWSQVPGSGPSPRFFHAMAFDSTRNLTILFGGWDGTKFFGDTWVFDGSVWTHLKTPTGGDIPGPSPRVFHRMAFDSARGVTVLFGGNDGADKNDTWEFDGAQWTQRDIPAPVPDARRGHAMAFDSGRNVTLLFGGQDGGILFFDDTWELNCVVVDCLWRRR